MNFGVIIGDSIAEGHPDFHGRLHTINGEVDLSKENEEGQISWYLERHTGIKVYNNGIGSQTTEHIKQRWLRDALGNFCSELEPASTLPGKPEFIVLCAGINDVWPGTPANEIINNLKYFISSAISNNVSIVVFTIGPQLTMDVKKLSCIKEVNSWIMSLEDGEAAIDLAGARIAVFDFFGLTNDPGNDGEPKPGVFCDEVHPTADTYSKIAEIINDKLRCLK